MPASRNDQFVLGTNGVFQNRVQASLLSAAVAIGNESVSSPFHRERDTYVAQILGSVINFNDAVTRHAFSCATDATVIADATQGGTVALTSANVAAQQALVTDAHIDSALSAQFNTFFRTPGF